MSASKVERAIRHAIEVAWNRGRVDTLNRAFGCRVCTPEDKPTNEELVALDFQRMILLFMDYCASKQLRPKTMHSYEKTLKLFAVWLLENEGITKADTVKEMHKKKWF